MQKDAMKKPPATVTSGEQELEHQIRLRAYELYEARGRENGHELEDSSRWPVIRNSCNRWRGPAITSGGFTPRYGSARRYKMDLRCPNCNNVDLKKLSLVCQEGRVSVNTRSRLRVSWLVRVVRMWWSGE